MNNPLLENYLHYLDEVMGMISLVPRRGLTDDLELSEDELVTKPLRWGSTETVTGPTAQLTHVLKPSNYSIGGGLKKYLKDIQN